MDVINCKHEWWIFSTCIGTVELMCTCKNCGAFGTVPEPTIDEWDKAFWAPEKPYQWNEPERVFIQKAGKISFSVN